MVLSASIAVVGVVIFLVWYFKRRNDYFKQWGIPGPKPVLVFGNLLECSNKTLHEAVQGWTSKFGKVYGYYEGGTPVMIVSDLDMIQEIYVKRFSTFHSRKVFPVQADPDSVKYINMFTARGLKWKRLRAITNPTFSAAKMKQMAGIINQAIDTFMEVMEEKHAEGNSFDIYENYQGLTMDVIGRCAFGIQTECQRDSNDDFLSLCKQVMHDTVKPNWIHYFATFFPELRVLWRFLAMNTFLKRNAFVELGAKVRPVLEYRKKTKEAQNTVDLLQLMLDAESDDMKLTPEDESNANVQLSETEEGIQWKFEKKLLTEEIIQQSMLFLIAGFETTSTALAYTTYLLATNPSAQQRLVEEIDQNLARNELPTYDNVGKLSYLDMVVHEALRMYPIATSVTNRTCFESCTLNGVTIPKGVAIAADIWTVHNDPEIWGADVKEFNPDRFEPEVHQQRHPLCWMPFGAGPRNCIGMRFALLEEKIALVRILQKFTFQTASDTQIPLRVTEGATTTPENGVRIKLQRR